MIEHLNSRVSSEHFRHSGEPSSHEGRLRLRHWLFPVAGFLALMWFLVRCVPKPSRATYPCQRAAFPIAAAFVTYATGLCGMAFALRKLRRGLQQSRYVLAGVCVLAAFACFWVTAHVTSPDAACETYVPPDPPNSPMGTARGIFPGRVAWALDRDATNWDDAWNSRTDIHYWDDGHTSQTVVDKLVRRTVLWMTEKETEEAAWDALFRSFNGNRGKGAVGYAPGERLVIKPNHVEQRKHDDVDQEADLSPQVLVALLKQLVNKAGMRQEDITVCDASRYIANKTFDRCHALFPDVIYAETNYYTGYGDTPGSREGRVMVTSSTLPLIHYSGVNTDGQPIPSDHLPMPFVEADYAINLAIMKGHSLGGVTLCAKNWYGSFCHNPIGAQHDTLAAYAPEAGQYRLLVDVMGHKDLGGKTMLYVLDGLWGFPYHGTGSRPKRWLNSPFNGDYPSSVLMSQDPVAIDSVGLDFLRAEFADNMGGKGLVGNGAVDDYLHEAAKADNAPSGVVYDPENDGTPLGSLGAHEHWNNATDKEYTRNLGTGQGIELVEAAEVLSPAAPSDAGAIVDSTSGIHWTWRDNSDNETHFNIYAGVGETASDTALTTVTANVQSWAQSGLSTNTQHAFQVSSSNYWLEGGKTPNISRYTLAAVPVAPVVSNPTTRTLDVAIGAGGGNPEHTQYAIQVWPAAGGNTWVQAGGAVGASAVWRTAGEWATETVSGLAAGTCYAFCAIARNGDGVETSPGREAQGKTLSDLPPAEVRAGWGAYE